MRNLINLLIFFLLSFLFNSSYASYEEAIDAINRGDEAAAWKYCEEPTKNGDLACINLRGTIHQRQGTLEQDNYAVYSFKIAAEAGFAKAQLNYAYSHFNGLGDLNPNHNEFIKWVKKAAAQGYGPAEGDLGRSYSNGTGVLKDEREATKWLLKAAQKDHAFSQALLGFKYATGRGVLKDRSQAKYWVQKAYSSDDQEAVKFAENIWNDLNLGGSEKTTNSNGILFNDLFRGTRLNNLASPVKVNPIINTNTNCRYIGNRLNCNSQTF